MRPKIRKAIFPVGGLGTRFLPATKAIPKEMLPVVDKPVIQYAVEEARANGIEEIIFVTGRGKAVIEDHFDHSFELESVLKERRKHSVLASLASILPEEGNIRYTRQQIPMGLGHAVWCARGLVGNEPFAVLLADDLVQSERTCLGQLIEVYEETGGNVVAIEQIDPEMTGSYGIVSTDGKPGDVFGITDFVEKPEPAEAPSNLAIIGRYILHPEIFEFLGQKRKGASGEVQLTDALRALMADQAFYGCKFEGRRFDCGGKAGFLKANIAFALQRPEIAAEIKPYLRELDLAD